MHAHSNKHGKGRSKNSLVLLLRTATCDDDSTAFVYAGCRQGRYVSGSWYASGVDSVLTSVANSAPYTAPPSPIADRGASRPCRSASGTSALRRALIAFRPPQRSSRSAAGTPVPARSTLASGAQIQALRLGAVAIAVRPLVVEPSSRRTLSRKRRRGVDVVPHR
jgi:hypothetical protein